MNNEIKEILVRSKEQQALDDLKSLANAKEDEEVYIEYGLNTKARILLDYITNLQEENERLKENTIYAVSILKDLKYIDKYKFTWDREFNKALNKLQGEDKEC